MNGGSELDVCCGYSTAGEGEGDGGKEGVVAAGEPLWLSALITSCA